MEIQKGWAIKGEHCGFYTGWWLTRQAAIRAHIRDLGMTWGMCRSRGDRAVKVTISEVQ